MSGAVPGLPLGETWPLWPGDPPGLPAVPPAPSLETREWGRFVRGVGRPLLEVHRPARPNGAAVLLIPGGGYAMLSYDNEGLSQAEWLTARGIAAFVLLHRLPGEGWADRARVTLQDAQRAIRLIRRRAPECGVDPARVAVLGFSAGGHAAGLLAARPGFATYDPLDEADALPARPALAALVYPVATFAAACAHGGTAEALLGPHATDADRAAWSVETLVEAATPPLFLLHALDDDAVPPDNSRLLAAAAARAGIPAELHLFATGGHGFATRLGPDHPTALWPDLWANWARAQGLFA